MGGFGCVGGEDTQGGKERRQGAVVFRNKAGRCLSLSPKVCTVHVYRARPQATAHPRVRCFLFFGFSFLTIGFHRLPRWFSSALPVLEEVSKLPQKCCQQNNFTWISKSENLPSYYKLKNGYRQKWGFLRVPLKFKTGPLIIKIIIRQITNL